MKLLGWMHRKFRQNSSDPLKDFSGQTSLDDQLYYLKRNNGTKHFKTAQRDTLFRKSFAGLEAARIEEEGEEEDFYEEESMAAASEEIFRGFLTIGTLGSESVIGDPATPSFAYSVENITEKDTEITENELKLINEELEKVLGSDAKEEWCTDSSGRNSHVSTGRSSYGSTITLSGKSIEGQETVCPLKGYLLNSATELPETTVAKKEHRTSLGELFQKTKMTEDDFGKHGKEERRTEKVPDKSAMHLLKKKLMKKVLHASSKGSNTVSGGSLESSSAETRMHKILHMFHKKVHPENSAATKDPHKLPKGDINPKTSKRSSNNGDHLFSDEDIMIIPHRNITKEKSRSLKGQPNPLQFRFAGNESNGNRECWIKTDADYLVLEL